MELSYQPIVWQQCSTYSHANTGQQLQVRFIWTIRMGAKLSDLTGMILGAEWTGLSIYRTADFLGFSHAAVASVCSEWCNEIKNIQWSPAVNWWPARGIPRLSPNISRYWRQLPPATLRTGLSGRRRRNPGNGSSAHGKTFIMREFNGEWPHLFEFSKLL